MTQTQVTREIKPWPTYALAPSSRACSVLANCDGICHTSSMFPLSQPIRLAVQNKLAALRRLDKRNPTQKPFYIFGAGGQGRCILNAALEAGYRPSAFLDDHPQASDLLGVPIFGAAGFPFEPGFRFVVGIGDCERRREKFDLPA